MSLCSSSDLRISCLLGNVLGIDNKCGLRLLFKAHSASSFSQGVCWKGRSTYASEVNVFFIKGMLTIYTTPVGSPTGR